MMTQMRSRLLHGLIGSTLASAGLITGSCATDPQSSAPILEEPVDKAGETKLEELAKPGSKDAKATEKPAVTWEQRYIKTLHPNYEITNEDLLMVQDLDSQVQPLQEAIALVIVLRTAGTQEDSQPGFVTRDLSTPDAEPEAPEPRQLQEEAKKLGFHFSVWNTLAQNPFLQLPIIYRHADQALNRLGNAPRDRDLYQRLINHRANAWAALLPKEEEEEETASPVESSPSISQMQIEPSTVGRYSLSDLNRGDALLRQAQRLAERGEFKQAIQYAARIADKDPLFPAASEKIKSFSNQAVQDLRQKAAQAFQSALPVNDRETRAAYLMQARQYLVRALEDFPEADHLSTVRENLAVISQDLDSLSPDAR